MSLRLIYMGALSRLGRVDGTGHRPPLAPLCAALRMCAKFKYVNKQ